MEDRVGLAWHRIVTRAASRDHDDAAVTLDEVQRTIRLLFRAGGGPPALRLAESAERQHRGVRGFWQKLAGSGVSAALPQMDVETLALPSRLAVFDDPKLNRALYLWLAAFAAVRSQMDFGDEVGWVEASERTTAATLAMFPGLRGRWQALLAAHLAQRPRPASARGAAAQAAEAAVQASLQRLQRRMTRPDAIADAPATTPDDGSARVTPQDVAPVWLWLAPAAERPAGGRRLGQATQGDGAVAEGAKPRAQDDRKRRRADPIDDDRDRAPMVLPFRAEALLSFAEFTKVNRADDDEDDVGRARQAADDLQQLSLAADGSRMAARVRFDLDLPSAAADDRPLGPGHRLPEWDFRRRKLLPDQCAVQVLVAPALPPDGIPPAVATTLRTTARRVRNRLESLRSAPRLQHGLVEGDELDVDAWVRVRAERAAGGLHATDPPVHARRQRVERSLATLLLADLSLSTEAGVGRGDDRRVIDVIREALWVFGQALDGAQDTFEMIGFSSAGRQHVRIQHLKGFEEPWGGRIEHRLAQLKPGFHTRMGAGLREATRRLAARPERVKLLLLLTDGKPHDIDHYEGRHGLEDTAEAVREARRAGLLPFAITIDEQARDYLPFLFGDRGHVRVRRPADLVDKLARLYVELTQAERSA